MAYQPACRPGRPHGPAPTPQIIIDERSTEIRLPSCLSPTPPWLVTTVERLR